MSTKTTTKAVTVTLADGREFALKTRGPLPFGALARGNGQSARWGRWTLAYLTACAAGAGNVGDRYLTCMLTGETFDAWHGGDVDRLGGKDSEYALGNICLVSARGNDGRGYAQAMGTDVPGVERYMTKVQAAAASVATVRPGSAETGALFNAYGTRAERNDTQSTTRGDLYRTQALAAVTEWLAMGL